MNALACSALGSTAARGRMRPLRRAWLLLLALPWIFQGLQLAVGVPGASSGMTGGTDKPLPILRLVFGDAHATWVHVDLHTGAVLGRTDSSRRASRWLFAMLHSWDWLPLLERRPVWDIMMVLLSIGGTVLSVTGIVIGWRRLGLKLRSTLAAHR